MTKQTLNNWLDTFKKLPTEQAKKEFLAAMKTELLQESPEEVKTGILTLKDKVDELRHNVEGVEILG